MSAESLEPVLERIAVSLESIAVSLSTLDKNVESIRNFADSNGAGFKTTNGYENLNYAILYDLYVNKAQILEQSDASADGQASALAKLQKAMHRVEKDIKN